MTPIEASAHPRGLVARGGEHINLHELSSVCDCTSQLALSEALTNLRGIDERAARVAELKLLGGLDLDEITKLLEVSTRTVGRAWKAALNRLRREL